MSWSTSELRVRLAPLNRFKPSSKIFYWPFQGGTSFVDLLCFCSVLCLLCFVRVCLYVLCGHLLGKGWPLGSRLWCLLWVCHFPIGILVRCGTWLYRFLIFAPLLTFILPAPSQSPLEFCRHITSYNHSRYIDLFVWIDSLRPINNLSVKQGRVFLGWTSTKLG